MKDNISLADRMKSHEDVYRFKLPRKSYVMLRIDGKSFSTFTKGLRKPFDDGLIEDMNQTAIYLCKNIMGAKFAYVQSDEISILITDFESLETQAWFDNNIQKMTSVAASMATASFNQLRLQRYFAGPKHNIVTKDSQIDTIGEHYEVDVNLENVSDDIASFINYIPIKWRLAEFDARVFALPTSIEVENYFIWRQEDAIKNSISSVAQSVYSHKQLNGINSELKKAMLLNNGVDWDAYDSGKKQGRFIEKINYVDGVNIKTIPFQEIGLDSVVRNKWEVVECSVFTKDRGFLRSRIKSNE